MSLEKTIKVYITQSSSDALSEDLGQYVSEDRVLRSLSGNSYDLSGISTEILLAYALKSEGYYFYPPNYSRTSSGKPISSEYFLSLSHSGGYCCCCLSDSNVGVDIQIERKLISGLERKLLSKRELNKFSMCSDKNSFLMSHWTAKESCLKLTGKGIAYGMNKLCVELDNKKVIDTLTNEEYYLECIEIGRSNCDFFVNSDKLFLSVCTKNAELIDKIELCYETFSSIRCALTGLWSD